MKKQTRLTMRKIREIFRLYFECKLSYQKIGKSVNASQSRCFDYIRQFEKEGLTWPLSSEYTDEVLENVFKKKREPRKKRETPDYPVIHKEMKKKGVTLFLLWQEYRMMYPGGYGYTQFCYLYGEYVKKQDYCLRQEHKGGDKLFVDYSGQKVPVYDSKTGIARYANIFVGCLGASQYTYAEATWSQKSKDWLQSHVNAFEHFGGVPHCIVPDNLKSGVTKPCWYDPDINPTYQELAKYYGTAILPTRVGKPKDKGKVESSVFIVERWILAALRNYKFFDLESLNLKIRELLLKLNQRPFKKMAGNREELYKEIDAPCLKPLPEKRFELCNWITNKKVHIDYHVEVEKHYYSVPYKLIGKKVDVRLTINIVEIFYKGQRVASHRKSFKVGHHTTEESHRPQSHREYLKWSP